MRTKYRWICFSFLILLLFVLSILLSCCRRSVSVHISRGNILQRQYEIQNVCVHRMGWVWHFLFILAFRICMRCLYLLPFSQWSAINVCLYRVLFSRIYRFPFSTESRTVRTIWFTPLILSVQKKVESEHICISSWHTFVCIFISFIINNVQTTYTKYCAGTRAAIKFGIWFALVCVCRHNAQW